MGKGDGEKERTSSEAESIRESVDTGNVNWRTLRLLALWRTLDSSGHAEKRAVAEDCYMRAFDAFKTKEDVAEVAVVSPVGGAYVKNDGELRVTVDGKRINFEWSKGAQLLSEADVLAEEIREWWREDDPSEPGTLLRLWRAVERTIGAPSPSPAATERRPHSMRLYGLATRVLRGVQEETERHPTPAEQPRPLSTPAFEASLATPRGELTVARNRFRKAAQRGAQSRYWRGMVAGATILAVICAILGAVFWAFGVKAAYGVALPAGGLGAIVSVLQRMSSGKMKLDFTTGRDLLEVFGAVRPFIGAIFGIVVMALLLGGIVPAIDIPEGEELAFFAGVGFLAGFNERWAQDMLKGSAGTLGGNPAGGDPAAEIPGAT